MTATPNRKRINRLKALLRAQGKVDWTTTDNLVYSISNSEDECVAKYYDREAATLAVECVNTVPHLLENVERLEGLLTLERRRTARLEDLLMRQDHNLSKLRMQFREARLEVQKLKNKKDKK